jgi:hypothetical protein
MAVQAENRTALMENDRQLSDWRSSVRTLLGLAFDPDLRETRR